MRGTKWHGILICCVGFLLFAACSKDQPTEPKEKTFPFKPPSNQPLDAFTQNTKLGRGINLGNALEAPNEGDWGLKLEEKFFDLLHQAGFHSVRVPIKWSAHASESKPYQISATFFQRIDWVVENALKRNLAVVLNIHHYDEIFQNPATHKERFLSLWQQIAMHYKNYPDELFFEILNEPHDQLTANLWNEYLVEAINTIRSSNPYRILIIGGASWNSFASLTQLKIPANERGVIVTFHYYNPFQFTHQGAEWVSGSNAWLGTTWSGTPAQRQAIDSELDQVNAWAKKENRPIHMGEFGAYNKADLSSRVSWTSYMARRAEFIGFSWSYWEFGAGFGIYDPKTEVWNTPLLKALIP